MNRKRLIAWATLGLLFAAAIPATGSAQPERRPQSARTEARNSAISQSAIDNHTIYLPLVARDYPPGPPLYRLYADPADLAWLDTDPYRDETIPATFCAPPEAGGRCWEVDLRYRGDVSRLMPKKNWKAFFPGADLFQGQEELNLNADYPDQTLLRSYLSFDLFTRAGVPSPQAGYARLNINDAYYGLFSQVEQIDERFLYRQDIEIHGNLYKPFYGNLGLLTYPTLEETLWWYAYYYPKKTNRESGLADIIAFIELINNTPDQEFPQVIAQALDVNEWLDWYAVNILLGNFEMLDKNYYLYHDLSAGRWIILPWDVDLTFGHNAWGPGIGGLLDEQISWDNPIDSGTQHSRKYDGKRNHLIDRMMDVPEFRFAHCRRLAELMADEFSLAEMTPRIDAAFSHIYAAGAADPNRWQPACCPFSAGAGELKTYIANRITFLQTAMITFCPDLDVPLALNELMAANTVTIADEAGDYDAWIEIHNGSGTLGWDLGGMYLTDVLDEPTKWRIPDDARIPPGGVLLIWADGEPGEGLLHASFALSPAGGQIGLFDRDEFGNAPVSTLTYTIQAPDVSWGRLPDGTDVWQPLAAPTPGWLNVGRPPVIAGTTQTPTWPTSNSGITISATITDAGPITATLRYRLRPPSAETGWQPLPTYQSAPMSCGANCQFVLPAQANGTWVEYYIEAQDATGLVSIDRPGWPQGDYRAIVGWQRPPLYINELMALNTHTVEDDEGDHDDWIELYNAGPAALDLGGMYLSNNLGLTAQYTIPNGTVITAGGYLVLWADSSGVNGHLNFSLSGAGEYVGLFDSHARYYAPIDMVYFDPQTPDVSWGRFPDPSTGSGPGAWYAMDTPTPGGPNRLNPPRFTQVTRAPLWPGAGESVTVTAVVTAGTPPVSATLWYDTGSGFLAAPMACGADCQSALPPQADGTLVRYYLEAADDVGQRTLYPTGAPTTTDRYLVGYTPPAVLVNEFLADNATVNQDEVGEYDDWLELYNAGAATITLDGMYLTDHLDEPTHWQFPPGTSIPPGGYLLVWCDEDVGQGPLHTDFKLDKDGEGIGLFDTDAHGNVRLDAIVFGLQQEDISYGRRPDGAGTWTFLDPPTPGGSNGY